MIFLRTVILLTVNLLAGLPTSAAGVVVTTPILQELYRGVVCSSGEGVQTLIARSEDPHSFQITPSKRRLLSSASHVLAMGLGTEPWLRSLGSRVKRQSLALGDSLYDAHSHLVSLDRVQHKKHGHGSHGHAVNDPHFFHSPTMVLKAVGLIAKWVNTQKLQNEQKTEECLKRVKARYKAGSKQVEKIFSSIPKESRKIVLKHQFLGQFSQDFDFKVFQLAGFSSQERVSPKKLRTLLKKVEKEKARAVFIEKGGSRKTMTPFLRQKKVVFGGELWADNLGKKGSPAEDLVKMWIANAKIISHALNIVK